MATQRKNPEEKIAELEHQQDQLKARIQREKAKLKAAQRKADTRRKVIAGALALEHQDEAFQATLRHLLDAYVTRDADRALFDLPPLPRAAE